MLERLSDDAMLPHNREKAKRWLRRKRQVSVAMIPILLAVALIVPEERFEAVWVPSFAVFIVVIVGIELKRVAIFRQDLRDRRSP